VGALASCHNYSGKGLDMALSYRSTTGVMPIIQLLSKPYTPFLLDAVLDKAVNARLRWLHRPRHIRIDGIMPATATHPKRLFSIKK
jgi:hypothetical protein